MSSEAVAAHAADSRPWLSRARRVAAAAALVLLFAHAWTDANVDLGDLASGSHNLAQIVGEMFPPDWGVLHASVTGAILTFDTALIGTTVALVVSLLLAPLAARNITPHRALYELSRALMGIARTIPLWVSGLLFLVAVGISPFAGVLALALETIGVLAKLFSEAIEEMDMGPVDALRVSGASRSQVFLHGVLPAVTPTFIGLAIYRMDSNVRSALVLSAFGAGGIGFLLFNSIELFQWRQVSTELLVMFVLVLIVERASIVIRGRIS